MANHAAVLAAVEAARPEVVFHLAGLSTVQAGLEDPVLTYTVNAIGTANVLQAVRDTGHARAVVSVTTDKVYLDRGSEWGYREDDRLGGSDPYSSSKVCQELVTGAFRDSLLADRGHRGRERPRGQRDRRRRPDRRAPDPRPDPRRPRRHAARGARTRRDPALAARPQPALRLPPAGRAAVGGPDLRDRVELRPRPGGVPTGRAGSSSACARAGRASSPWSSPSRSRCSSPRYRASTARGRAPASAGGRPGTSPAAIDATVDWHLAHRDGRDPVAISLEQIERFTAELSRPLGEQADSLA